MSACHCAVWGVVLFDLRFLVLPFKRLFVDFALRVPALTEWVIDASDFVNDWPFVAPLLLLAFMVSDMVILFLLRRQRTTVMVGWLWFVLMLLVPLGMLVLFRIAIQQVLLNLFEGLSK